MDIGNYRIYTDSKFWLVQNLINGSVVKRYKYFDIGRYDAIAYVRSIIGIK